MDVRAQARILLSVRSDERILAPARVTRFARQSWFTVTLAAILAAHAALLAILLWRDASGAPSLAKLEETPVEVVTQMPEPPKPAAAQPPAQQPPPEKPAASAPRAPNDEQVDRDAKDSDSRAPKATAPPAAPPPQQADAAERAEPDDAKSDNAKPDTAAPEDSAAKPPDDARPAEALDREPPEPPRRPAKLAHAPSKPAPAKAPPSKTARTALQQLAGASDLPDYTFAKPMRKRAKATGGTEDDRYLAVVYAMVTRNHEAIPLPDGDWSVAVSFQVDGHGDLIGIGLTKSSGYAEIDAAAVHAVEEAAPFPPPPSGGVTGLVARLNSAHARAAALAR